MPQVTERQKLEEREGVVLENEGQKIFGILHRPITDVACPAIVMCHGLAGNKTGKHRLYVFLAQKLAEVGIASLRIDFRGSGDSEGDFSEMTLESEVSDTITAIEYLKNHPLIDNTRLGLFGRSVGGVVALLSACRLSEIKSLSLWASIFDGHQWMEQWKLAHSPTITNEQRTSLMRFNGQVPSYDFFKQLFGARLDEQLIALSEIPLLNIHGEKDEVVDIEHANRFMRLRANAKGDSEFIRLPYSDHEFSYPEEQQIALNETCKWFANTL